MLLRIKLQQGSDVVGSLAQGGGGDGQDVDAVIQVFPETPCRHF
jgi:hypothetical protein